MLLNEHVMLCLFLVICLLSSAFTVPTSPFIVQGVAIVQGLGWWNRVPLQCWNSAEIVVWMAPQCRSWSSIGAVHLACSGSPRRVV
jgi:hypothetical protein